MAPKHDGDGWEPDLTPLEWDAATYDRVSTPQLQWALPVLDRLDPEGVDVVLEAGCGSGRVTEVLLDRLPGARVVALDGSQRMLDEAARRLAPEVAAGRVTFVHADLGRPFSLDRPVGAVLSTATFHWVTDQDTLAANLAAALRPGGQLVAQCGGAGNIASVLDVLASMGETRHPWHFAGADEAAARLRRAGFADVRTWLHDEPTVVEPGEPLEDFLATVVLAPFLEGRPAAERDGFVRAVAAAVPGGVLDYVRLNIVARRAAT